MKVTAAALLAVLWPVLITDSSLAYQDCGEMVEHAVLKKLVRRFVELDDCRGYDQATLARIRAELAAVDAWSRKLKPGGERCAYRFYLSLYRGPWLKACRLEMATGKKRPDVLEDQDAQQEAWEAAHPLHEIPPAEPTGSR